MGEGVSKISRLGIELGKMGEGLGSRKGGGGK